MIICTTILLPFYIILLVLIPIIAQIITTVCGWVSSFVQVITQVVSQVCQSLPWPLSMLCNWVTELIAVLEKVWNYVCNTILQTIINFITMVATLLIYLAHVVCIIVNIFIGLPSLFLCLMGLNPKKRLHVCIKVLTNETDQSAVTDLAIEQNIARMYNSYGECAIDVSIVSIERIVKPEYLATTGSAMSDVFSAWHVWFTQRACWCCSQVTVFVVDNIVGAGGLTFWGDNWCRVDAACNTDDSIMAHEIGHLLSLDHVNDPNNVMYTTFSAASHEFTAFQCCLAKRSPFVTSV